jgi:hypothetical protein
MYRWLLVLTVSLLLVSCGNSSGSSISVQTNRWQLDGNGFVQLLTNDEQYYGRVFVTDFTQTRQTRMDTVTAVVKKQSGSLYGGYGIIFCYGDSSNYYRLLIDAAGQYSVYAKINDVDSAIIPWTVTASPNLKTGVGVENVISVRQITLNNFVIYFNGAQESSFNNTAFSGGTAGFAAYVYTKDLENFPYTAVDVRFKLTSPLSYP